MEGGELDKEALRREGVTMLEAGRSEKRMETHLVTRRPGGT